MSSEAQMSDNNAESPNVGYIGGGLTFDVAHQPLHAIVALQFFKDLLVGLASNPEVSRNLRSPGVSAKPVRSDLPLTLDPPPYEIPVER